jgi:prepilin-type N-terminal cleavage/methylation domain-containing protein
MIGTSEILDAFIYSLVRRHMNHKFSIFASSQAGFTLLELLVTMVVTAILLAIAVPSFMSTIQKQHANDITSQFSQDLAWAQGEALSGQAVVMTINADGSWATTENGSVVTAHTLTSAQLQADAPGAVCALQGGGSCAVTMTFDSTGIVSGAPVGVLQYTSGSSSASFQVFASGVIVVNPSYAS